jgi:hypothetical protein
MAFRIARHERPFTIDAIVALTPDFAALHRRYLLDASSLHAASVARMERSAIRASPAERSKQVARVN